MHRLKGISGRNVLLRAIERDDLAILRCYVNDPGVMKFSNVYRPVTELQQEQWYRRICEDRECSWFAIVDTRKRTGGVVGVCSLVNINWVFRTAELRIRIGTPLVWGKGLGTGALRLLIRHGFNDLNLTRLWVRVHASNQRALHLYEKLGFRIEGRLEEAVYIAGSPEDMVLMGLLRSRWIRGVGIPTAPKR